MRLNPQAVIFVPGKTIHRCRQDVVKAKRSNNANALRRIRHRISKLTAGLTSVQTTARNEMIQCSKSIDKSKKMANAVYTRIAAAKKISKNIGQSGTSLEVQAPKSLQKQQKTMDKIWLQKECGICPETNKSPRRYPDRCKRLHCLFAPVCPWLNNRRGNMHGTQLTQCFMAGHEKFKNPPLSSIRYQEVDKSVKSPVVVKTSTTKVRAPKLYAECYCSEFMPRNGASSACVGCGVYADEHEEQSRLFAEARFQPQEQRQKVKPGPFASLSTGPSQRTQQQRDEDAAEDRYFAKKRDAAWEVHFASSKPSIQTTTTPKSTVQPIQAVHPIVKVPSSPKPSGSSTPTNQSLAADKTSRSQTPVRTANQSVPQQEPKRPAVLDSHRTSSVKVSSGLVPQTPSSSQEPASSSKTKTFTCAKCKKEICKGDPWIKYDNKFLMHTKCHRCRICFESFPQEDNTSDEHPACSAKQAAASALKSIKGKFW